MATFQVSNLPAGEMHWKLWIKLLLWLSPGLQDVSLNAHQVLNPVCQPSPANSVAASTLRGFLGVTPYLLKRKSKQKKKNLNQNSKSFRFRSQPKSLVCVSDACQHLCQFSIKQEGHGVCTGETRAGSEHSMINISQLQMLTETSKEKENLNRIWTQRASSSSSCRNKDMIPKAVLISNHEPDTESLRVVRGYIIITIYYQVW